MPIFLATTASAEESKYSAGIEIISNEIISPEQLTAESCERADVSIKKTRTPSRWQSTSDTEILLGLSDGVHYTILNSREYCLVYTKIGIFGGDRWAENGDLNNAVEVKGPAFTPIPGSRAVVYKSRSSSDPYGALRMSINYNFTHGVLGQKTTGGGYSGSPRFIFKTWRPSSVAPHMKYLDGNSLVIRRIMFSDNGRYGVMALSGGMLVKVDIDTQQMTPIVKLSPFARSWQLKISNDGNYVLSHDRYSSGLKLHDLTGCSAVYEKDQFPKPENGIPVGTDMDGCASTALGMRINHEFSGVRGLTLYGFRFSPASNQFFMYVGGASGTNYNKVTFSAVGYESSAQGYLAMGDSFASGEGDTKGGQWYEPGTDEQGNAATFEGRNLCHLSRRSYPYLLAMQLGYLQSNLDTPPEDGLFHSVACSGAKMHNIIGGPLGEKHDEGTEEDFTFTDNQYRRAIGPLRNWQPGVERQGFFLKDRSDEFVERKKITPEVITIGIGGNDVGFSDKLAACLLPGTCELATTPELRSAMVKEMISERRLIKNLYLEVKAASPESKIYAIGYPVFVQSGGGTCGSNVHLDAEERYLISNSTRYFNSIIELAAREAGVTYVDVQEIFQGVNLCSDADDADMTVNGVTAGNDISLSPVDSGLVKYGLCVFRECVGNETYHPNPVGHVKYTGAIRELTNDFNIENPDPELDIRVNIPDDYFGFSAQAYAKYVNGDTLTPQEVQQQRDLIIRAIDHRSLVVGGSQFYPGSDVSIEIHSTPTALGSFTAGSNGELEVDVIIPDSIEGGYHEIHMTGIDTFGNPVHYYQSLMLAHAPDDFDGDGVLDSDDSCVTIFNLFVDEDNDGLDDACDNSVLLAVVQSEEPFTKGQVSSETVAGTDAELASVAVGPQVLGSSVSVGAGSDALQDTGLPVSNNVYIGLSLALTAFVLYLPARLDFKASKAYTKK